VLITETGPVTERLRVREIDDDEGRRLVRIVRRGSGSVVTWRRAQMVLLSAQGMDVAAITKVAFTSEDRVRDVIRNFNADGWKASPFPDCGNCILLSHYLRFQELVADLLRRPVPVR
jgi:hypothetical protein